MTPAQSMLLEENAFIELTSTSEMKNLLRIFFLQEKSKKLLADDTKPPRVNNAVVVGAGTMGAGITQWLSSRGLRVMLKDVNDELISKGLKNIGDLYVKGVLSHKFDRPTAKRNLSKIYTTTKNIPLHNKDILIEAIVEDLDIKQQVLAQLEEKLSNDAIIATNTSALSIDDMAACLKRPERFIGIHFFNPVHKMKLVEVVKGSKTSDATVRRAVQFVQQIGKLPVVVNDSPGFVVNRILLPYLIKAAELLDEGVQIESIDKAIVKFGMPMGPFRLMDEIGLDVCYHVADDLNRRLDLNCSLEEILWRVEAGRLGKKAGQGFYTYKKGRPVKRKVSDTVDITSLISTMTEEAQKVIDEGVIDDPDMLDFAMIMGTGWAPFRGGPLTYRKQSADVINS
jgi:3-hydroxyacyl-CoA dehydrogenase/enoyl-CoA hydratase/3-hydroxybutyryl-CoA epimerase